MSSVPSWRAAATASGSVGTALFPIGLTFGVVVAHSGLEWWWAPVFSSVIFAGSLEFILVELLVASVPLPAIAVTAFLINVRHVFYALSFPLHRVSRAGKPYSAYALTDEAYALTARESAQAWSSAMILWVQGFIHAYWVVGATAGALLGALIPDRIVGLDFTLTALFTVLMLDAFHQQRDITTTILALLSVLAAYYLAPGDVLLTAFSLFTASLAARYLTTQLRGRCA